MPKYRKKPVVIDATQWFKNGDHKDVSKFNHDFTVDTPCGYCRNGLLTNEHGWVNTLEGGHIVCPGDFIITGIEGEHYPCKPDIFEKTYELVED